MNKLGTKLGAIAMSAVMALTFAPSAAITSLAASGDGLLDATLGVEAVERLYNPYSGEHLFTTEDKEISDLVKLGWNDEGVAWKAPLVDGVPVYRLYNPNSGDHHYTTSLDERVKNLQQGWVNDNDGKAVFYGAESADPDAIPVYRLYNPNEATGTHHYTTDADEKAKCLASGWTDENSTFSGYPSDYEPEKPVEELKVSINNPTPKVGDTIRVLIYDEEGNKINPADVDAEIQWYADSIEITGADEAEYDVLVGDVGVKLSACVTIDGEEYWTSQTAEVEAADGQIDISSAKAKKVNEIEVTFANPVDSENVSFVVKKGALSVPTEDVEWNDDEDVAVITTSSKMTEGTYTVTATDTETADEASKDFEVLTQHVEKIVIDDVFALTSADKKTAYAYYDVKDQYDESMRASTSITWSGSAKIEANKANGQLKLTKTDGQAWVYNDKIYVTGVQTSTGVAVSKELTVGTEQALDSVKVAGFVKKGDTTILTSEEGLPKDFKTGEYYLLYNGLDQNGDPIDPVASYDANNQQVITFVSDNILVVKEIKAPSKTPIVIAGVEYEAAFVEPGIRVSDGGKVTLGVIANKTGRKDEIKFNVGEDTVIDSFTMFSPEGTVADGDTKVVIPFEAKDAKGNPVTDFETIAKQATFNALSLTASEGKLVLSQKDNGSAALTWSDAPKYQGAAGWAESQTTDGVPRPISLTAVVVGGKSNNIMFNVSDKRRPESIAAVKGDSVHLEGDKISYTLTEVKTTDTFKYYDQYGELIKDEWGADNGFFWADSNNALKGNDFANYHFGVRVTNAGSGKIVRDNGAATDGVKETAGTTKDMVVLEYGKKAGYDTATDIKSVASTEGFKFDIVKLDNTKYNDPAEKGADKWDSVSTSKFQNMSVVDISQVKNFSIDDLNTFYTGKSTGKTGDGVYAGTAADLKSDTETFAAFDNAGLKGAGANGAAGPYQQKVVVKGTYDGKPVTVPATYYLVKGDKLGTTTAATGALGENVINNIILYTGSTTNDKGLKPADLYDKTTATGVSIPGKDTLKASIYGIYSKVTAAAINYKDVKPGAEKFGNTDSLTATAAAVAVTDKLTNNIAIPAGTDVSAAKAIVDAANARILALKYGTAAQTNNDAALGNAANANTIAYNGDTGVASLTGALYDTASIDVAISDQTPVATEISGLKDSYTINPGSMTPMGAFVAPTEIINASLKTQLGEVVVKDQYGVTLAGAVIAYKASNVIENSEAYADNNFAVSGNDTAAMAVKGAERLDTFDLVLTSGKATATTEVTVGADITANITGDTNNYQKVLVVELEKQRINGLQ